MWLRTHGTQAVIETLPSDHDRRPLNPSADDDDSEYNPEQQAVVIQGTVVPAVSHRHRSHILMYRRNIPYPLSKRPIAAYLLLDTKASN